MNVSFAALASQRDLPATLLEPFDAFGLELVDALRTGDTLTVIR